MVPGKPILFVFLLICLYSCCTAYCESEWKAYSDHCYYVSKEEATWYKAETRCRELGAHLTSILSKREDEFVFSIRSEYHANYWIGLRRKRNWYWYSWSWTDDSSVTYPKTKDYRGEGACVSITGLQTWQRVTCNTSKMSYSYYTVHPIYYICKKKAMQPTTTTASSDPLTSSEPGLTTNTSKDTTSTSNGKEALNNKDNSVMIIATSVQTSVIVALAISLIVVCTLRKKKGGARNKPCTSSIPAAIPSAPVDIYENADVVVPEQESVRNIQKRDDLKQEASGCGGVQERMGEENHAYASLSEH